MTDLVVNTTNANANSVYTDTTTNVASAGVILELAPGVPMGTVANPLNVTGGGGGGGSSGGFSLNSSVTPTITASSAYASGNVVGGLMTFANFARTGQVSAYLQNLICTSLGGNTAPIDVIFFAANPSSSTFTDKSAISINSADVTKICGVAQLTNWINGGTPTFSQASNLGQDFVLATGTSLYAVAVVRGTPTFASTSDLTFRINGPQD